MKTIYLCGNLGPKVGLGHFYRLLAFAQMVGKGYHFRMVIPNSELIANHIPEWLETLEAPSIDQLVSAIPVADDALVVVDSYEANKEWFNSLKQAGILSIHIDDHFTDLGADAVINHAPGAERKRYSNPRAYCGSDYALLRPRFTEEIENTKRVGNLLICIGGADPLDLSFSAVQLLRQAGYEEGIDVILGAAYSGKLLHSRFPGVAIKSNLDDQAMAALMEQTKLAIAPASTTAMELCSRRTPFACGMFVDNQKDIYRGIIQHRAAFDLGDLNCMDLERIKNVLDQAKMGGQSVVQKDAQTKLIDLQSGRRLREIVMQLFGPELTYREAGDADWKPLLDWRNDPITRANSFDTGEIDEEQHKAWFANSLKNPNRSIYIFEFEGQDAGMVRADSVDGEVILSWNVAPSMRGKGLGKRMVAIICDIQELPSRAEIKPENIASRKIAEFCGMRQMERKADMLIYGKP